MYHKRMLVILLVASVVMLASGLDPRVASTAYALPSAQISETIPYIGNLADETGQPVPDGAYDFSFVLYPVESGGEALWTETQTGVAVQGGGFSVLLGSLNPLPQAALDGAARWLELGVRGLGETAFTLLSPRQELSAANPVAPASPSNGASSCAHTHWGEHWTGSGVGLRLDSSNDTAIWANSAGGWAGVDARNTTGAGVFGTSVSGSGVVGKGTATTGTSNGVWGEVASSATYPSYARGVVGWATKTTGLNYGVWGQSESSIGVGVIGLANSSGCTNCIGVSGESTKGDAVRGDTETGNAVAGYADGNGVALYAQGQYSGNLIEAWHGPMFPDREFYVSSAGEVYADGNFHAGGADLAEMLPAVEGLQPGDVLVVGEDGQLTRSSQASQSSVVGVYSTTPGFVGGDSDDENLTGKIPLAVIGVVPVKVSAENGPIHPGDLLVTSSTPGHAMKAGPNPSVGTVIGKSLGALTSGVGVIQMLVMLQ